jgi:NAD(P)-dependent dehydrogenase (short-subunit alcohol dehydrogenase family)
MKTMLVTGSSGLIGSEVVSYFANLRMGSTWLRQ